MAYSPMSSCHSSGYAAIELRRVTSQTARARAVFVTLYAAVGAMFP